MALVIGSIYALFGFMARSAVRKGGAEAYWFFANIVLFTVIGGMLFGPAAVVVSALMVVPAMFYMLISLTRGS